MVGGGNAAGSAGSEQEGSALLLGKALQTRMNQLESVRVRSEKHKMIFINFHDIKY